MPKLRALLIRGGLALLRWCAYTPYGVPADILAAARQAVQAVDAWSLSSHMKGSKAFGALLREFPDTRHRVLKLAVELAVSEVIP